jgi:hypothetical protein
MHLKDSNVKNQNRKTEPMQTTANTITIRVPFALRHMLPDIKAAGGRFDSQSKTWTLPDTLVSRSVAEKFAPPPPRLDETPEERVRSVSRVAADLLSGLNEGRFVIIESTARRVVLEKAPSA